MKGIFMSINASKHYEQLPASTDFGALRRLTREAYRDGFAFGVRDGMNGKLAGVKLTISEEYARTCNLPMKKCRDILLSYMRNGYNAGFIEGLMQLESEL